MRTNGSASAARPAARDSPLSRDGSDSSSIRVYSCFGASRMSAVSPASTTFPWRSITTWSA
jgi:hypothetical protein